MLKPTLHACLCLPLFAAACDKSSSVGEIDTGSNTTAADDGSSGTDGGAAVSESGTDGGGTGESGTGELPTMGCGLDTIYEPPSCQVSAAPSIVDADCYTECSDTSECPDGYTCQTVQYDPCPCPPEADACCGACSAEIDLCMPPTFDAFCGSIIGKTFYSLEQMECGQSPTGTVMCNWTITFGEDGNYLWMHSDVGEGSDYTCQDGVLDAAVAEGFTYSFDPTTGILTWGGVDYQAMVT